MTDADSTLHKWLNPKWCSHAKDDGTSAWYATKYGTKDGMSVCLKCKERINPYLEQPHTDPAPFYADWRLLLAEDGPLAKAVVMRRHKKPTPWTPEQKLKLDTILMANITTLWEIGEAGLARELAALVKELQGAPA